MRDMINADALASLTQIILSAAREDSVKEQVYHILEKVSDTLQVDVCTLYRRQPDNSLKMLATHGLIQTHPVILPEGKGLVGIILKNELPLNIIEPSQHPGYYYVRHSKEEKFRSFCGVPLVYRGQVNGVLVVQSRLPETLTPEQEAVLSTIAIHLALLLDSFSSHEHLITPENHLHRGVSGAPGLTIGKVIIARHPELSAVTPIQVQDTLTELNRWQEIKNTALTEFAREKTLLQQAASKGLASVTDVGKMMLQDPAFERMVTNEIARGFHLPWGVKQAVSHFCEKFMAMCNPYLQARHEDVEHLGDKLYQIWLGSDNLVSDDNGEPLILIGERISVSTMADLSTRNLTGIVCSGGASLSHIAILANALGIPAVMGTGELALKDGDTLIVDGDRGEVIVSPGETLLEEYQSLTTERQQLSDQLLLHCRRPTRTKDNEPVVLMANTGLQADIEPGLRHGAEGIGLFRTEIPFMASQALPSEEDQVLLYSYVLSQYQDKPVCIRTLDVGSDKPLPYLPLVPEDNPALGLRGIRYTLDNLSLFTTQLRALLRATAEHPQLCLLLPMISTTEQLDMCLSLIDKLVAELKEEGYPVSRPPTGIMVEVPGCIPLLPFWADKIDFISVGTNDLSQYLLAVDRNNPLVSKWYHTLHPAILHELMRIVRLSKDRHIPVSICGEMAADPVAVALLTGMGIRKLSMSASKIPLIKSLISEISVQHCEALLDEALTLDTAEKVYHLGSSFLARHWSLAGNFVERNPHEPVSG
ncbi:phosphoenolpyruvate--protein phosphotransferase [Vibrio quintilis]|uniref:phosphoenolpyruvate--protein phosphotransferase n=1 Tax=Vibrio quintilis TaxID=1117707 RepID=A0A1M7YV08_9VIBR|nr:phosphoenolpyruvate--protein phosphotransferase [Vibrio quintilis]SHO56517.1 Phosphoenolpyruvate-protein phosphotransferase [Vibrio quintilis]